MPRYSMFDQLTPRNAYSGGQYQPPPQDDWADLPDEVEASQQDQDPWADIETEPVQTSSESEYRPIQNMMSFQPNPDPALEFPSWSFTPGQAAQQTPKRAMEPSNDPWLSPANQGFQPKYEEPESLSGSMYGNSQFQYQPEQSTMGEQPKEMPHWAQQALQDYDPQQSAFNPEAFKNMFTGGNAIAFGGSALGDIGRTLAPETYGLSMALPFIGGAGGELGRQWYAGEPWNFKAAGVEGLMNYAPGAGKLPGWGSGAADVAKYAMKSGGHGAVQGLAGSLPRKWAKDGMWDKEGNFNIPTQEEAVGQMVMGGLTGATVGGLMGTGSSAYHNARWGNVVPPGFTGKAPNGSIYDQFSGTPESRAYMDDLPNAKVHTPEGPVVHADDPGVSSNDMSLEVHRNPNTPPPVLKIPYGDLTPNVYNDLFTAGYTMKSTENGVTTWVQPTSPASQAQAPAATPNNVTPFRQPTPAPTSTPNIDSTLSALGVQGPRQPAHNQGDPAWDESQTDMTHTGPVGVVQPSSPAAGDDWITKAMESNDRVQVIQDDPDSPWKARSVLIDGVEFTAGGRLGVKEVQRIKGIVADPMAHQQLIEEMDANGDGYLIEDWERQLVASELNKPSGLSMTDQAMQDANVDPDMARLIRQAQMKKFETGGAFGKLWGDMEMQGEGNRIANENTPEPPQYPLRDLGLTQPNLPLNKRTIERAQRGLRPSVPTDTSEGVQPNPRYPERPHETQDYQQFLPELYPVRTDEGGTGSSDTARDVDAAQYDEEARQAVSAGFSVYPEGYQLGPGEQLAGTLGDGRQVVHHPPTAVDSLGRDDDIGSSEAEINQMFEQLNNAGSPGLTVSRPQAPTTATPYQVNRFDATIDGIDVETDVDTLRMNLDSWTGILDDMNQDPGSYNDPTAQGMLEGYVQRTRERLQDLGVDPNGPATPVAPMTRPPNYLTTPPPDANNLIPDAIEEIDSSTTTQEAADIEEYYGRTAEAAHRSGDRPTGLVYSYLSEQARLRGEAIRAQTQQQSRQVTPTPRTSTPDTRPAIPSNLNDPQGMIPRETAEIDNNTNVNDLQADVDNYEDMAAQAFQDGRNDEGLIYEFLGDYAGARVAELTIGHTPAPPAHAAGPFVGPNGVTANLPVPTDHTGELRRELDRINAVTTRDEANRIESEFSRRAYSEPDWDRQAIFRYISDYAYDRSNYIRNNPPPPAMDASGNRVFRDAGEVERAYSDGTISYTEHRAALTTIGNRVRDTLRQGRTGPPQNDPYDELPSGMRQIDRLRNHSSAVDVENRYTRDAASDELGNPEGAARYAFLADYARDRAAELQADPNHRRPVVLPRDAQAYTPWNVQTNLNDDRYGGFHATDTQMQQFATDMRTEIDTANDRNTVDSIQRYLRELEDEARDHPLEHAFSALVQHASTRSRAMDEADRTGVAIPGYTPRPLPISITTVSKPNRARDKAQEHQRKVREKTEAERQEAIRMHDENAPLPMFKKLAEQPFLPGLESPNYVPPDLAMTREGHQYPHPGEQAQYDREGKRVYPDPQESAEQPVNKDWRLQKKEKKIAKKLQVVVSQKMKDKFDTAVASIPAHDLSSYIDHSYADGELSRYDASYPNEERKAGVLLVGNPATDYTVRIVYRDNNKKLIARAVVSIDKWSDDPLERDNSIPSFVSDKDAGGAFGIGVVEIAKEFMKLGAFKPAGSYSAHTKNFFTSVQRYLVVDETLGVGPNENIHYLFGEEKAPAQPKGLPTTGGAVDLNAVPDNIPDDVIDAEVTSREPLTAIGPEIDQLREAVLDAQIHADMTGSTETVPETVNRVAAEVAQTDPADLVHDGQQAIVTQMREGGLVPTTGFTHAHFILPDGSMVRGRGTHEEMIDRAGLVHSEVLQHGIIQYEAGRATVSGPISLPQARQLVEGRNFLGRNDIPITVNLPDGTTATNTFGKRVTESGVYSWVRRQFANFEEGWNSTGDGTTAGAGLGGMPFNKAKAGFKKVFGNWGMGTGATGARGNSRFRQVMNAAANHGMGTGASKPNNPNANSPDYNIIQEALQVPKNAITAGELSAAGRQGLGAITYPAFWKALKQVPGSLTAQGAALIQAKNASNKIYVRPQGANGKELPSLADKMGIKLSVHAGSATPGPRMQHIASKWLEEGIGDNKGQKAWRATGGKFYRVSNRIHLSFINTLTTNLAESLADKSEAMSGKALAKIQAQGGGETTIRPGVGGIFGKKVDAAGALEYNPWVNDEYARELGDFVKTATGQAPQKFYIIPHQSWEVNMEPMAGFLNKTMFSTGLFASRVRATQPATYAMATPSVRKEYMRSLLGVMAYWWGTTYAMKMAYDALGYDADVSHDFTSSDFGKVRVGNARSDMSGGYQQFLVNYGRIWAGGKSSAAHGTWQRFGEGYRAETQGDNFQRFMANKLEPVSKFAYDLAYADQKNPFHVGDRLAQMAVSLYHQDLYEISKEDPGLLPMMGAASFIGGGTQVYDRNESVGKLIAPENDWLVGGGGGIRALMPWNWDEEPGEYQGPNQ